MVLTAGFLELAVELQEAASISGQDVQAHLGDAVQKIHSGTGGYGYYRDHIGDDKSGDVIYSSNGKVKSAPYSITGARGKASKATIEYDKAKDVKARVVYEPEQSAGTESATEAETVESNDATFVESALATEVLRVSESAGELNPLVKIISAGRGSTGYYTENLLKRDGPAIFKRGTLMYINHATNAEEAARPEGDWSKLAAVTTGDAYWDANGKDGAALYAPAKVFANVAAEVREKAPYTGVSIRAAGLYAESSTGKPKRGLKFEESKMAPDGKPGLIGKLTRADSIDLVTKAGRDGKLLLESAVQNPNEGAEVDMTEAEIKEFKELRESMTTLQADNRKFKERAAIADAAGVVAAYFGTVNVPTGIKERVTKRVLAGSIPLTESGDLDRAKLTGFVEAETKDEAAYVESLTGNKIVTGMGAGAAPEQLTEAQRKELETVTQRESDDFAKAMGFSGKGPGAAILREGRGEFDLDYNSGKRDGLTSGAKAVN